MVSVLDFYAATFFSDKGSIPTWFNHLYLSVSLFLLLVYAFLSRPKLLWFQSDVFVVGLCVLRYAVY